MALLVFNITGADVTLAAGSPVRVIPASTAPPARGVPVNVTSELRGLTAQNYIDLQAQAASLVFEWTSDPEYATGTLVITGPSPGAHKTTHATAASDAITVASATSTEGSQTTSISIGSTTATNQDFSLGGHETFLAPAAGASAVLAQQTDDYDLSVGFTAPDYPRNLEVIFGASWPGTVHVYVEGRAADGSSLKEIIQANPGNTVVGVGAFATVSRSFSTLGTDPATATPTTTSVTPGAGVTTDLELAAAANTVFGVARLATVSFFKLTMDAGDEAIVASSATRGTFKPTTVPNGTHNYDIWFYSTQPVTQNSHGHSVTDGGHTHTHNSHTHNLS